LAESKADSMGLHLDPRIKTRILGVSFGYATVNGVCVRERDERLWERVEALSRRLASEYALDRLAESEGIVAVRGLQKTFGFDPTRYRPSSEALLRRVLKGSGIYQINTAVDVNNLCSLEFLLPICIYDLRHVHGQIRVRPGEQGETYPGIGRQEFLIENRVIVADDDGVMGNTVSDAERTKVTQETSDLFLLIYAPPACDQRTVEQYTTAACQRMVEFNGGQASDIHVLTV